MPSQLLTLEIHLSIYPFFFFFGISLSEAMAAIAPSQASLHQPRTFFSSKTLQSTRPAFLSTPSFSSRKSQDFFFLGKMFCFFMLVFWCEKLRLISSFLCRTSFWVQVKKWGCGKSFNGGHGIQLQGSGFGQEGQPSHNCDRQLWQLHVQSLSGKLICFVYVWSLRLILVYLTLFVSSCFMCCECFFVFTCCLVARKMWKENLDLETILHFCFWC